MNFFPKRDIKKWCETLRSGKYEQTKYRLQDKKGYCCLGVACKIFIPKDKQIVLGERLFGRVAGRHNQPSIPIWLEEIDDDFAFRTNICLSDLNDHEDLTFEEIADCLEAVYIHKVLE